MDKIPKTQCLHCGSEMQSIGVADIQLGHSGLLLGIWSNVLEGSLAVEVYMCSGCGKLEFYSTVASYVNDGASQTDVEKTD